MNNSDLSNKILERINEEKIAPIAHWRFVLYRSYFWLFALLSMVVGAFAFAAILFIISDFGHHGLRDLPHDIVESLLMIPFAWIIILIFFAGITRVCLKFTKKGYQYKLRSVLAGSLITSVVFGYGMFLVGLGKITHESLRENKFYKSTVYDSRTAWGQPEQGRLAGVVIKVQDKKYFSIVDFTGKIWMIQLSTTTATSTFRVSSSSTVRIVGLYDASSTSFVANNVSEWEQ